MNGLALSIVVSSFNETAALASLWARVAPVLDTAGIGELVLVGDGSGNDTWEAIRALAGSDDRVVGVHLSRNFGQQSAISAGLEAARGQAVLCIDADLQDPPELIDQLH